MYQIAIIPNNTDANLSLSYGSLEKAEAARQRIWAAQAERTVLSIHDDYGYILCINGADIAYALYIDLEQAQFCQHEKQVAIARAGKKLADLVNGAPQVAKLLGINQPPVGKFIQ